MDEDEAAQREAEHKAAALHNLGWETGAGATVWARAVRDGLAQHEEARARYAAGGTNIPVLERREMWERLHATVLMLARRAVRPRTEERCPGTGLHAADGTSSRGPS